MDTEKDQNSILLLHKRIFGDTQVLSALRRAPHPHPCTPRTLQPRDITAEVKACFPKDKPLPLSPGDLFAVHVEAANSAFVLASFHGDTQVMCLRVCKRVCACVCLCLLQPFAMCTSCDGEIFRTYDSTAHALTQTRP